MKPGHSVTDKTIVPTELLVPVQLVTNNTPSPRVERSTLSSNQVVHSQGQCTYFPHVLQLGARLCRNLSWCCFIFPHRAVQKRQSGRKAIWVVAAGQMPVKVNYPQCLDFG